jgi:hypothetical protein
MASPKRARTLASKRSVLGLWHKLALRGGQRLVRFLPSSTRWPPKWGSSHHPGSIGLPSQRPPCASWFPQMEYRRDQLPLAFTSRDASSIEPGKGHRIRFDLTKYRFNQRTPQLVLRSSLLRPLSTAFDVPLDRTVGRMY